MTTSTPAVSGTMPAAPVPGGTGGAPAARPSARTQVRRSTSSWQGRDVGVIAGAAGAALALTWLLFGRLTPMSGVLGFVVVAWLLFIATYALLVSLDARGPIVRDRIAGVVVHSLAAIMLAALVVVVVFTLYRGREALTHLNFLLEDMTNAGPLEPLDVGGILHAVVGTLQQITIALLVTVPLGIACAVFLNEVPGKFARLTRTIVEAMTALPSIVAGLFIYATLIIGLGQQKSGFAAAMAISVMMLPIIIRAADVVLRLVPGTLREASYALGSPQWRTVWQVILPTARSGLVTAVILGTARGIGETSPVLLTAGYTTAMNANPTAGPQVSLPLAVFNLVKSPEPNMIARGFGCAAVLMVLVLVLFFIARIIGGRPAGTLSKRQARRRTRASARLAKQFDRRGADLPVMDGPAGPAGSAQGASA